MSFAEWQMPSPRYEATGPLGALAGIVPGLIVVAWTWIAGWSGTPGAFLVSLIAISVVAVVAGWVVGSRVGASIRSSMLGVVAYAAMAWLIYVPVGVIGSSWQGIQDGSLTGPVAVVVVMFGLLAYGLVSSIYMVMLLVPLGTAWMVTLRLLQRAAAR